MIGRTVSHFQITAKLGEGGMGAVWRATDLTLGREVALKFLPARLAEDPTARTRFLREARAASVLEHPGIATVYEAGEFEGQAYIAMQLVEGATVADRLKSGPMAVNTALQIARETADALGHAHERGILHRDISARNVMLRDDGQVVVVDFGLARMDDDTRLTNVPGAVGTAAYIAPEVVQGGDGDRRSDLYSLGVLLFECLTGRAPFRGSRVDAVLYAAVHETPVAPSTLAGPLPAGHDEIVLRLLAKNPNDRPESASSLSQELLTLLGSEGGSQVTTAIPTRHGRLNRRMALLSVVFLSVVAVASWIGLRQFGSSVSKPREGLGFNSVAVLPFRNDSADSTATSHLVTSFGRQLSSELLRVGADGSLLVLPWASSSRAGGSGVPLAELARALQVEALVWGSIVADERHVSVEVSIIDGETGFPRWGGVFDDTRSRFLELQSGVVTAVAKRFLGELTQQQIEIAGYRPSESVEAYDLFMRGREALDRRTSESVTLAKGYFEESLKADSLLVESHLGLGAVYLDRLYYGWSGGKNVLRRAAASYERALELEPDNMLARRGLIHARWEGGDSENILLLADLRAPLRPFDLEQLMLRGETYFLAGLPRLAIPFFSRLLKLDPANEAARWWLPLAHCWASDFEAATETGMDYLRMYRDESAEGREIHTWLGLAYLALDREDRARVHFERSMVADGSNFPMYHLHFGVLEYQQGDTAAARQRWTMAVERAERNLVLGPGNKRTFYQLGLGHQFLFILDRLDGLSPDPVVQLEEGMELDLRLGVPRALVGDFRGIDVGGQVVWPMMSAVSYHAMGEMYVRIFGRQFGDQPEFRELMDRFRAAGDERRARWASDPLPEL